MLDVIVDIARFIFYAICTVAVFAFLLYLLFDFGERTAYEEHYQKVYEEGVDFLDSLQQEGLTPLKFAKLSNEDKKEHFAFYELDAGRIKEFMTIAIAMPTFPTINARVVDLWWPEYKITRQAIRRYPKPQ